MQEFTLSGEQVFLPLLFQMDQGPATFTERQVLQARKWKEIVFAVHAFPPSLRLPRRGRLDQAIDEGDAFRQSAGVGGHDGVVCEGAGTLHARLLLHLDSLKEPLSLGIAQLTFVFEDV